MVRVGPFRVWLRESYGPGIGCSGICRCLKACLKTFSDGRRAMQISRIRLSDKTSRLHPRPVVPIERSRNGLQRLFRQFSWPYGIPSHVAPETPGSIHEGGELGYSLAHAYGAAFDNPDLIVACIIGDGEAETGALTRRLRSGRAGRWSCFERPKAGPGRNSSTASRSREPGTLTRCPSRISTSPRHLRALEDWMK